MTETVSSLTGKKSLTASSAGNSSPLPLNPSSAVSDSRGAKKKRRKSTAKDRKVYYIQRSCIGCQVCRAFCPEKAIRYGDCRNEIDQSKCVQCGTCYLECPVCAVSETRL